MNHARAELQWPTEPPNAKQASVIVAWIAVSGAVVFGILLLGLYFSGQGMRDWRGVFIISVALVQLELQAGASACSFRIGSRFAMLFLTLLILLAIIWAACSYNPKQLFFLTVSAIVSISAVAIECRKSQHKFDG